MKLSDNLFKKIENKTGVEKSTILDLASKLQDGNMKNEEALRDVIKQISSITGKNVSKEKEDKIVNTILNDKVPNDLDKMI
ncbi:MAG TPA: stage VI sporulation protein F [Bacilli bacterium]|jgi:hypothetical protein|nr:stage VI sporulation protein F [Mycoplasmatota bacterium]MDY4236964.1 stage VI sporulation protein F [Bacilli bacterium]CDA23131.1 yjcC family transcription regulator [Mycoplasma sp. CAG:611]HJJ07799.1 stage VI sporulation protein F [Bacilli bacterium]